MKRSELKRGKGPTRKAQNRVWTEARKKCAEEGRCRSCLILGSVEAAHTIGRKYQDETRYTTRGNPYKHVPANAVIPLCSMCHRFYDERKISILSLLSFSELLNAARASRKWGLNLRRRLTGER